MPRCLLIASSSKSGIDYTEYPDENAAKTAMAKAYQSFIETHAAQIDDSLSGVHDNNALAVTEDETCFWDIYSLFIPQGSVCLTPITEKPDTIIPAYVEGVVMPNGEVISQGRHLGWLRDFIDPDDGHSYLLTKEV